MTGNTTDAREGKTSFTSTPPAGTKPPKITGAELETRFDQWAADRRRKLAEWTAEGRRRALRRGVAAVLGLGLVGIAAAAGLSSVSQDRASASNNVRIEALRTELAAGEATGGSISSDAMAALSAEAVKTANRVATEQNKFSELHVAMNNEVTDPTGNGAPGKATDAMVAHRQELAKNWAEKSLIVDASLAYTFTTLPYYEDDEIDPRFPWYVRYDGVTASNPASYGWSVEAAAPRLDSPTTVDIVWTCTDAEGTVLAWADATYDGNTAQFSDLKLVVTAGGAEHQQTPRTGDVPELAEGER